MKKVIKEYRIWLMVSCLITLITSSSLSNPNQVAFSFDILFPMGWYQKGLEASLSVWYMVEDFLTAGIDVQLSSSEIVLGRLAFAQFCISRMVQEGDARVSGDTAYFGMVLGRLKELLLCINETTQTKDFVMCADGMIAEMINKLSLLK
jgi:hypothetical protein